MTRMVFHGKKQQKLKVTHAQSADIAKGVDLRNKDEGAVIRYHVWYACNETEVLMPAPIHYSHKILRLMAEDRKAEIKVLNQILKWLHLSMLMKPKKLNQLYYLHNIHQMLIKQKYEIYWTIHVKIYSRAFSWWI